MNRSNYNGWTNYETWAVALWLDNEQGSQGYWLEQATNADAYDLAQLLKDEHEQALPELNGFAADLLNAAMSEVNWQEIAEHFIEAAKEQAEA